MPHIENHDLLELHKTLDKSNEERDEFETVFRDKRNNKKRLKNERDLLIHLSTVSLLFLLTVVALYWFQK